MNLKRLFRELKRDDMEIPNDMFMSNNNTQATRVRVEVMKAIIKKCASNEERMFLHQHCKRPFTRITNTRTKKERILTFTDMVENYGPKMEDKDLEIANKRAGFKFKGQMKQIFGILKEKEEWKQNNTQTQRPMQHNNQNDQHNNNKNAGARKRRAQEEDYQKKKIK
jgi:hypothetical protein